MKLTSIRAGVSAALVSASSCSSASPAPCRQRATAESNCLGNHVDEDCQVGPPSGTITDHGSTDAGNADLAAANLATAAYQDVEQAEAAGYVSTLETLGCFEDPQRGGMGLHYTNEALTDATVDVTAPEALLYELDTAGHIAALVAHEYIVPIDAWTTSTPPRLFGRDFHRHPDAAGVDPAHLDLEGQPDGRVRGLQPTCPSVPRRRARLRRGRPAMSQRCARDLTSPPTTTGPLGAPLLVIHTSRDRSPQPTPRQHSNLGGTMSLPCTHGLLVAGVCWCSGGRAFAPSSSATTSDAAAVEILPPDEPWGGVTHGEWAAQWWQRVFTMPEDISPYFDPTGERCGYGQSGPVFFCRGTSPAERGPRCVVAEGTAIYVHVAGKDVLNGRAAAVFRANRGRAAGLRQCSARRGSSRLRSPRQRSGRRRPRRLSEHDTDVHDHLPGEQRLGVEPGVGRGVAEQSASSSPHRRQESMRSPSR